jgi:predicted homoserine dehydrogenase-like protein
MFGMSEELMRLEAAGTPIKMAVIGAGQMGRGMVSQVVLMKGMIPAIVADIKLENARNALLHAGIPEEMIKEAKTGGEASDYIKAGKYVITEDAEVAIAAEGIPCIVDATGVTEIGARIAVNSIKAHKHIVMLNVEADVVIGPLLYKMAKEEGVIYSGSAGDEPGAVMELYDFATALGFDVLVIGKGKNNRVDLSCNPDSAMEEAKRKNMSPKMLTAFKDGTKTMVEMTAMANATGFAPAFTNGSGYEATVKELDQVYRLKSEGGILDRYQVVDYINGVAPGVYAIVTSKLEEVRNELTYLQVGPGPNYTLFRPYHLTSLETPMSVARIVCHGVPSIVPKMGAPYAETTTIAKVDLKAGDTLDGIGGYTVYGGFYSFEEAKAKNALPLGLVNKNTKLKQDVKKGELITYDMVELDQSSYILGLRREQDELLEKGKLVW